MKGKPQSILILCTLNLLTACQTKMPTPPIGSYPASSATNVAISPRCQSFNLGDNLQPQLSSSSLQLNLPVARLNNSLQGRSVVLIPVTDSSLLYEEADQSQLTDLESIEKTVRSQMLTRVSPEIAFFLSNKKLGQKQVKLGRLKA